MASNDLPQLVEDYIALSSEFRDRIQNAREEALEDNADWNNEAGLFPVDLLSDEQLVELHSRARVLVSYVRDIGFAYEGRRCGLRTPPATASLRSASSPTPLLKPRRDTAPYDNAEEVESVTKMLAALPAASNSQQLTDAICNRHGGTTDKVVEAEAGNAMLLELHETTAGSSALPVLDKLLEQDNADDNESIGDLMEEDATTPEAAVPAVFVKMSELELRHKTSVLRIFSEQRAETDHEDVGYDQGSDSIDKQMGEDAPMPSATVARVSRKMSRRRRKAEKALVLLKTLPAEHKIEKDGVDGDNENGSSAADDPMEQDTPTPTPTPDAAMARVSHKASKFRLKQQEMLSLPKEPHTREEAQDDADARDDHGGDSMEEDAPEPSSGAAMATVSSETSEPKHEISLSLRREFERQGGAGDDAFVVTYVCNILATVARELPGSRTTDHAQPDNHTARIVQIANLIQLAGGDRRLATLRVRQLAIQLHLEMQQRRAMRDSERNSADDVDDIVRACGWTKSKFQQYQSIGKAAHNICARHPGIAAMLTVFGFNQKNLATIKDGSAKSLEESMRGERIQMLCKLGKELMSVVVGRSTPSDEMARLESAKLEAGGMTLELAGKLLQPWYQAGGCGCAEVA